MITELEKPPPKPTGTRAPQNAAWDDEEPEISGFKKWRVPVIAGLVLAGGISFVAHAMSKKSAAPQPKQETTIVHLVAVPPPPLPPPPPPQAEEKKQEMIEEVKQEDAPPEPAPQVETALKGGGNTGMVLKSGNGNGIFANRNTVSSERLRWSAYAGQVKSRLGQMLESNPKTRQARMTIEVRVWLDDTGRIARSTLDGSSSDSAVDAAIRELLPSLQISAPPPQDMPMPIKMRITARRPN